MLYAPALRGLVGSLLLLNASATHAATADAVGSGSHHLAMAHQSLQSLIGSLPAKTANAIAEDPVQADKLFEHDPEYIAFARHIRDHRNQWAAGQRRRTQEGWLVDSPTVVARMVADLQQEETDPEIVFADEQRVSSELREVKEDVAAPRAELGFGAGVAPFDHLQSVFSREQCNDVLAENDGEAGLCTYSCATLEQHFFPPGGPLGPMDHCFLYNAQSRLWHDSAGGPDLLARKKTSMDWFEFLPPTSPTPAGSPLAFTIGDGAICRNVTVQIMTLGPGGTAMTTTQRRCLMDGHHEHVHSGEAGSFQVIGHQGEELTENITHAGGGVTQFVVGECTDITLRITTTQPTTSGADFSLILEDGGVMDPVTITVPGSVTAAEVAHEFTFCMFQNDFTLTLDADAAGWVGTVQVLTIVEDNTIYVPENENWIVQGLSSSRSGVPVVLNARIHTGQRGVEPLWDGERGVGISHANIVLRNFRFSGQVGALDKWFENRTLSTRKIAGDVAPRIGGAFFYEGFGGRVVMERMIFDHNLATSGACMFFDGRMDLGYPSLASTDIQVRSSFFWENWATWVGGVARISGVAPLKLVIEDCVMVRNQAFLANAVGAGWYADHPAGVTHTGRGWYKLLRTHTHQEETVNYLGAYVFSTFPGNVRDESEDPPAGTDVLFEDFTGTGGVSYTSTFMNVWDATGSTSTPVDHHTYRNGLCDRTSANGGLFGGPLTLQGDHVVYEQMRIQNTDGQGQGTGAQGGALRIFAYLTSTVKNCEFINNVAGLGGALWLGGTASHVITDSLFEGNQALVAGGAAFFQTSDGLDLLILNSVFLGNSVSLPATEGSLSDVTFRLFTANTGVGSTAGSKPGTHAVVPIWFIGPVDDTWKPDPFDGNIEEMRSRYLSTGEFFDGNLGTNGSQAMSTMYAKVLRLPTGMHRLWHGSIINTADSWHVDWDGGGWIDAVGVKDKIFPTICDNRAEPCQTSTWRKYYNADGISWSTFTRDEGCYTGVDSACSEIATDLLPKCCARGQLFWSYTDFNVPYGDGGAVFASTDGAVTIRNTSFAANSAGIGPAINALSSQSFELTNCVFDDDTDNSNSRPAAADFLSLTAVEQETCETFACESGSQCEWVGNGVRMCQPCLSSQIGDGRRCVQCLSGTEPNHNQTVCVGCPPGSVSTSGVCIACGAGKTNSPTFDRCVSCNNDYVVDDSTKECTACPPGQQADSLGIQCIQCTAGTAGVSGICSACPPGKTSAAGASECTDCPVNAAGLDGLCTVCQPGEQPNTDNTVCEGCPPNTAGVDGRCQPCGPGTAPSPGHLVCELCPEGAAGMDGACVVCPAGKQPSTNHTLCTDCPAGTAGATGKCTACAPGKMSSSGQPVCSVCPAGQQPDDLRKQCVCSVGTYDATLLGIVRCEGFVADITRANECMICKDLPCLDCSKPGAVELREGWAFYGVENIAYTCPFQPACPARVLNSTHATIASEAHCAVEYSGPTCASCKEGFNHFNVGGPCDDCDQGTVNVPVLLGVVFMGLSFLLLAVTGGINWLADNNVLTDFRIIISLFQILGQADAVLDISFPEPLPTLMEFVKLLFLDVRKVIRLDCWQLGGFAGRVVTNVFVVPMLFVFGCYVYYLNDMKTGQRLVVEGVSSEEATRSAYNQLKSNLFLGIFLLYPTMTATLFRIPHCRELGREEYHEEDYTLECSSSGYLSIEVVGLVTTLLIPIGVPAISFYYMRAKVTNMGGAANMNSSGGAKLVLDSESDDSDGFAFLVKDFKPEYYYHEIVHFSRKLILNGVVVFFGRGSMGQIFFAVVMSVLFLNHHVRTFPYVVHKHNVIEGIGQTALLLVYVCCLVLRNDSAKAWSNEWFKPTYYGFFLAFLYFVVVPSPIVYTLSTKGVVDRSENDEEDGYDNPLSVDTFETDISGRDAQDMKDDAAATRGGGRRRREGKGSGAMLQQLKLAQAQTQAQKKEIQKLKKKLQTAQTAATAATPDVDTAPQWNTRRPSQVMRMKELVDGGLISDETFAQAKQSLEAHVSSTIAEQAAVIAEQAVEVEAREEAVRKSKERLIAERSKTAHQARSSLRSFLDTARLLGYEEKFLEVCGKDSSSEDLLLLAKEDIEELVAPMTRVEAKRFAVALEEAQASKAESTQ